MVLPEFYAYSTLTLPGGDRARCAVYVFGSTFIGVYVPNFNAGIDFDVCWFSLPPSSAACHDAMPEALAMPTDGSALPLGTAPAILLLHPSLAPPA